MRLTHTIIYIICLTALLASCNSTKYVGNGEYLLDKNIIRSDNKEYKAADLKGYLQQQPNFKAFGLLKWQLYVYNWSSAKRPYTWWNRQLQRIGEAPVLLDTILIERSVTQLERFMENKGYLNAEVIATIDTVRPKKAVVTYNIHSNEPYRIAHYDIHIDDTRIDSIAHLTGTRRTRKRVSSPFSAPASDDFVSLVHEGNLFDRDVLDSERQRITTLLRRRGYYQFNKEYLAYLADTTYHDHGVDLEMQLRPFRHIMADGSVQLESHKQYYIKDVTILTDYDPLRLDGEVFTPTDSIQAGDLKIIYGQSGRMIRPNVLRRANYIRPGRLFNERTVDQTYSSLASLRILSNVNIRYDEFIENDTLKLHAYILTTPAKVHGIGFDIEGTNSAGDFGFAASTNYQHRNLFKGSEVFSVKVRGAYEALTSRSGNYWEIGGETSLSIPRFVFPFLKEDFRRRLRASTEFRTSYVKQRRPEYDRAILSGGWSYSWQDRTNTLARHTFKLLEVDYLFVPRMDEEFRNQLHETTLAYNYSNQFIAGMGYSFAFNNYNPQNRQRNNYSFRFSVDLAGNLLYGFSNITKPDKDEEGRYRLFGIPYAQFAKTNFDFSRAIGIDPRNRIAYRLGVGLIYPYGNATIVPFERRFFSGGANSVRGWSVRSLGPGSMSKDKATFVTQSGDIRLDLSVEYRTKLFWKLELAGFLDAGNIWTIRKYEDQPNGNFEFSKFYKEIAFSYGTGLRLDFDFFLIRLDAGFKVYDPQGQGKYKWAIINNSFLKDNCAIHFAVGYPF